MLGKKKGAAAQNPIPEEEAARRDRGRRRVLAAICALSIAVAVASVGLAAWSLGQAGELERRYESDMATVVVAARDVPAGSVLGAADLALAEVPADLAPSDAEDDPADLEGRVTIGSLTEGVPIPSSTVRGSDAPGSLSTAVTPGSVAVMLSLDAANGASPLLSVGDTVDVIGTVGDGVTRQAAVCASGVRVLAIDGEISAGASKADYSRVTLELSSDEALQVLSASGVHLAVEPAAAAEGAE